MYYGRAKKTIGLEELKVSISKYHQLSDKHKVLFSNYGIRSKYEVPGETIPGLWENQNKIESFNIDDYTGIYLELFGLSNGAQDAPLNLVNLCSASVLFDTLVNKDSLTDISVRRPVYMRINQTCPTHWNGGMTEIAGVFYFDLTIDNGVATQFHANIEQVLFEATYTSQLSNPFYQFAFNLIVF